MKKAEIIQCGNIGMIRDKAISKLNGEQQEFAFDNHNIRITVNDTNTELTITNEKGTKHLHNLQGAVLGTCVINNNLILFTHTQGYNPDYIYLINEHQNCERLYNGDLGFDLKYPIETLGYYESEDVQKVYWVDGKNPNRFINIKKQPKINNNTQFDCCGTIHKIPTIQITKNLNEQGQFPEGTIQYFATYYNKFGNETNIVWQSDLQYLSKTDRGCKEGETATGVFDLSISNVDVDNYDYLRIYSVIKTSNASEPIAAIVKDIELTSNNTYTITDTNTATIAFPAKDILFVGGQLIIAQTLEQKRNTLFIGGVTFNDLQISDTEELYQKLHHCTNYNNISESIHISNSCKDIEFSLKPLPTPTFQGVYSYKNQLEKSQQDIAGFKYREIYRFAVQFQTEKGEWSDPIYIGDKYCNVKPELKDNTYYLAQATYTMNDKAKTALDKYNAAHPNNKFVQVRLLMAEMSQEDRRILAQGVVNPTMFNYYDRLQNKPYSMNSWMFRPRQSKLTNRHYDCMYPQDSDYAEIQGITEKKIPGYDLSSNDTPNSYALIIGLFGDWGTWGLGELYYEIYFYRTDDQINTQYVEKDGELIEVCFNETDGQRDHNTIVKVVANSTKNAEKNEDKKLNTPTQIRQWLLEELNKHGLNITDQMLPTDDNFRSMATATGLTDNPGLIWSIVGASIATVAMVALTICTFGASTPLTALGTLGVWSAVIAGVGTLGAAIGAAGVAAMAEALKDAPDVDVEFAKKGFWCLLPEFQHTDPNQKNWSSQYANWQRNLFKTNQLTGANGKWQTHKFTQLQGDISKVEAVSFDNGLFNENNIIRDGYRRQCTLVAKVGRLTFLDEKTLDAQNKQEQYYIDESIVTLNSPELEYNAISDLYATQLDLIGTIPITASYSQVRAYTQTPGAGSNAQVIPQIKTVSFKDSNIEGLVNCGLYQDTSLDALQLTDVTEKKQIPPIEVTDTVQLYKNFMWNRDTSLSCYVPNVPIIDPIQLNDENTTYLSYVPAIPKSKIFSNLKYSHSTTYRNIYTLDIEIPKFCDSDSNKLIQFITDTYNRNYYNSVNTLSLNQNGYNLLYSNNSPCWENTESFHLFVHDPVSIKYNTTNHIVIPLKWENGEQVLLPYTTNEEPVNLQTLYNTITNTTQIEGKHIFWQEYGFVGYKLPKWESTEIYSTDPLMQLKDGEEVDLEIIETYYNLLLKEYGVSDHDIESQIDINYESDTTDPHSNIFSTNFQLTDPQVKILLDVVKNQIFEVFNNKPLYNNSGKKYIKRVTIYNPDTSKYTSKYLCFSINDVCINDLNKITLNKLNIEAYRSELTHLLTANVNTAIQQACDDYNLTLQFPITTDEYINGYIGDDGTTYVYPYDYEVVLQKYNAILDPTAGYRNTVVQNISDYIKNIENIIQIDQSNQSRPKRLTSTYNTTKLSWKEDNPYLFLGELVKKEFDYNAWLGGTSTYALKQLNWNVCSQAVNIGTKIDKTWGDTYYQRWDCLKTYPSSEEDKNSIVDVLSFMVETHINLDGRCDVNRGVNNLLNARPTNFNLLNTAYTQNDNFFSYKINDEKLDKTTYNNQILWSLTKIPLDDIDKWTNINAVNFLNINGAYGKLNKILNVNDTLIAFQDSALSTIDYDLKAAMSTMEGVPIQLGNTNKVTGYTVISPYLGCQNKWSICNTENGVYFIDDNTKSLYAFSTNNGPINIGLQASFDSWFKENANGVVWNPTNDGFKLSYDNITKDLYISNNETCLVFNNKLQKFTSFMDYPNSQIVNLNSKSLLINTVSTGSKLYEMFEGEYNNLLDEYKPYWITYRLNPSSYTDNLFTNFTYVADCKNANNELVPNQTFTSVKAWNEYQSGELDLTTITNRHRHSKKKYRIWHGDIPRDGDTLKSHINGGDRMRNPWIFLKLTNDNINENNQMIFHNLTVTYYK